MILVPVFFRYFFFNLIEPIQIIGRNRRGRRSLCCNEAVVVFYLLALAQRLHLHLKFHGFRNILTFRKPENHIIAFFYTLFLLPFFLIKLCQLISPTLCIFMFLIFLKDRNLLIKRSALGAEQFVF